jgi:Flp pilus assembly protein TadG
MRLAGIECRSKMAASERGAVSLPLLVIMVPVLFGFMGFAYDLGTLYLVRGELNQAANAMALAAASKLNGTDAATDFATNASMLTLDNSNANANKYNFGSLALNQTVGILSSTADAPSYFATASDALSASGGDGLTASGTTAQYAQANITADAPLLFWGLLSLGQSRKTSIAARATAGISAPLCTACGIENFAIAAIDQTDLVNFGFVAATHYTFGYLCNGNPRPGPLTGDSQVLNYLLIDRYNTGSTFDETQQLFRIGAGGLAPSTDPTQACITINNTEVLWVTATPTNCAAASPNVSVQEMLCGLSTRLDVNTPSVCTEVTSVTDLTAGLQADTDVTALDDYTQYAGDGRRIMTVPVVDALSATGAMTILGFRQFLMEPTNGLTTNDPTDRDARFSALYIGYPAPVKQGRFDGSCGVSNGPGKVVLFQ